MSYHNNKKEVIDTEHNKVVAVATHEVGAEIIVKALTFYFGETFTGNQAVEMMHQNTANAFKKTAAFFLKEEYTGEMCVEYLMEVAEEMAAQALVVSMRDELKFDKPK